MESYPESEQVLDDLGSKVVSGIACSVAEARNDLQKYRSDHPGWMAANSEITIACWVHDRIWVHLQTAFDDNADVVLSSSDLVREMWFKTKYKFRFKRHDENDRVSAAATQTALDFFAQPPPTLAGFEEVHLVAGYRWQPLGRTVGPALLSLPYGLDKPPTWTVELPEPDAGVLGFTLPTVTPSSPTIVLDSDAQGDTGVASA
jgi:hypothetical protein